MTKCRKPRTVESDLSPYELVRLAREHITDENELKTLIHMPDRYHIVNYDGRTLATSKTLKGCIEQANRVAGWGGDAVVDLKRLVVYDVKYERWGAGHWYASYLRARYC